MDPPARCTSIVARKRPGSRAPSAILAIMEVRLFLKLLLRRGKHEKVISRINDVDGRGC
jgi:hypothetical protein